MYKVNEDFYPFAIVLRLLLFLNPMKVAIVINTSWNIYNFRQGIIQKLIENGVDVIAIAPRDKFSEKLKDLGVTYYPISMDTQGVNPAKDLLLIWRLVLLYRRTKPDVILHFTIKPNIYGAIASELCGIPCINNVSGLGTVFLKDNLLSKISKSLYRYSFKFANRVFFQNEDDKTLFLKHRLVKESKTDVLPGSGIDLKKFSFHPLPIKEKFTFLLISRIIQDKGIREFIEAIKQLRLKGINAHFQLLGAKDPNHKRGIPEEEINGWIADGLIDYLGSKEDVMPYIKEAHCVVLPSYREGTPRSLLESASMGRPLLATNVVGCKEVVISGYNGYLFTVKDSKDLADKMELMSGLSNEELTLFGANSRKLVESRFDQKIVVNKYVETIGILTKN